MRTGDSPALRASGGASVAELLRQTLLTGHALRPCTALLGKALLSGKTLLSWPALLDRRTARTWTPRTPWPAKLLRLALASWLALTTWLASAALPRLARAWSGATLLERLRTAGPLFAELLLLAGQTLLAACIQSRRRCETFLPL